MQHALNPSCIDIDPTLTYCKAVGVDSMYRSSFTASAPMSVVPNLQTKPSKSCTGPKQHLPWCGPGFYLLTSSPFHAVEQTNKYCQLGLAKPNKRIVQPPRKFASTSDYVMHCLMSAACQASRLGSETSAGGLKYAWLCNNGISCQHLQAVGLARTNHLHYHWTFPFENFT